MVHDQELHVHAHVMLLWDVTFSILALFDALNRLSVLLSIGICSSENAADERFQPSRYAGNDLEFELKFILEW